MAVTTERDLKNDARRELLEHILPFWRNHSVDLEHGGFIAQMSNDLKLDPVAHKGLILNARILWTFSAVSPLTNFGLDPLLAKAAFDYLQLHFLDQKNGGYFWELDQSGRPVEVSKKAYGQAFCIYALAQYYLQSQDPAALESAQKIFRLLEEHARDKQNAGYFEVLTEDWRRSDDMRLSERDMNAAKSMNTHLHVLEAYTQLFRVWPDSILRERLQELITIFEAKILDREKTHFHHFFDERWVPQSDTYTFGHDIEGSWLLCEAAEVIGDDELKGRVWEIAVRIAEAVLSEGVDADGGLLYEARAGHVINADKEWWPQAEAVVGFLNAFEISGMEQFKDAALRCWQFVQDKIVDHKNGEWFWRVSRNGQPDRSMPKISAWKCPYHNSRCCLEIIRRVRS